MAAPDLSIVVPVFERPAAVTGFHARLVAAWPSGLPPAEVVYVDDGSRDGTWEALEGLPPGPFTCRGLRLRRNAGQTVAMWTGWMASEGGWLGSLDADLEIDPSCLGPLWQATEPHHDLVLAVRSSRHVARPRRVGSMVWNGVTRLTFRTAQRDLWCAALLMRRELFASLAGDAGRHRQFKLLLLARARRPVQVEVPTAADDAPGYAFVDLARIGLGTYAQLARLPWAFVGSPLALGIGTLTLLASRGRRGAGWLVAGVALGAAGVLAGSRDLTALPPTRLPDVEVVDEFRRDPVGVSDAG